MGNSFNYSMNNNLNNSDIKDSKKKPAPAFYLSKKFPNYYNLTIEEVIQNFLKSKYDLLENKQLTQSLSKEFNLLLSASNKSSNNSIEKLNKREIEENIQKCLNSSNNKLNQDQKQLDNINDENIDMDDNKMKDEYVKQNNKDKNINKDNNNKYEQIIIKCNDNNNEAKTKNIFDNKENNQKDKLIKKKIGLDISNNSENNNTNNNNNNKILFLSDYNIYSCNEDSKENTNNNQDGENTISNTENIIYINTESDKKNDNNENSNESIEEKENETLFDNLSNKTDYGKLKGKNSSDSSSGSKKKKNNENDNNNINNDIKKNQKESDKNKKSSKASSKNNNRSHSKIRKYTEIEPSLITTQAASLMKDIRKEYKFKNCLGGGHFGTVRKAYKKTDKETFTYYAIKSIPMKNLSSNIDDFVKEVDIISTLDHPNIIKFYETYHDKFFFHIVMELCKGKEISYQMTYNGCMEEKKVVHIIFKVLLAIAHCHNRGITHRDLKPENILFDSMNPDAEIKLIDFGLSRKYDKEQKMHSILGTPYYVAPEVLKGEYDEKCDIWSIGSVTYLLLCGDPPFTGNSNNEIFKKIVNDKVKFNIYKWKNISNNAKDFVRICLNKNSIKRPSASEALNHPWFNNVLKEVHNFNNIKKEILINIKNYNINDKFKKMVLKYLINKLNEEEKSIYKAAFYAIDFNHNGFIRPQELKHSYDLLKIDITDEQIEYLFNILPYNKKLGMGYSEFIMAGVDQKKLFTKENLEDSFKYFDINKTGFIEYDNLNSALLRMGKKYVNSDDVISIINNVAKIIKKDEDNIEKYNKISKDDFMKIFLC